MILQIKTNKKQEFVNITSETNEFVKKSKIKNGLCHIYTQHTTTALTINENTDSNVPTDILNLLNKTITEDHKYLHNNLCDENNATSHIKSSLLGHFLTIPFENNILQFGQWQDIFLVELDGPRTRNIILNIIKTE
ncbi:MAG: secondary thiamine-phosphate synthase enzyme YjbQ [Nanoarchaeota archaeon]|nr:secondary thiamine-phosphate synthase enzyme YjbQ [Nanoarchaeota archaeon]